MRADSSIETFSWISLFVSILFYSVLFSSILSRISSDTYEVHLFRFLNWRAPNNILRSLVHWNYTQKICFRDRDSAQLKTQDHVCSIRWRNLLKYKCQSCHAPSHQVREFSDMFGCIRVSEKWKARTGILMSIS